jgi:hypothetical protein
LCVGFVQKPTILCEKLDVSPNRVATTGFPAGEGLLDHPWRILNPK